jgi:hypothetical protein
MDDLELRERIREDALESGIITEYDLNVLHQLDRLHGGAI